jgi:hypothetical protein
MKTTLKIVAVLVVAFLLIQFVPSSVFPLTKPPVSPGDTLAANARTLTPAVLGILERSCNDCHSNQTVWPWYSRVAPVSWLLSHDVTEGRRQLNLSEWAKYPPKRAANKLREICEQVERGEMPPWYYVPMHAPAKLTDADRKAICAWTRQEGAAPR